MFPDEVSQEAYDALDPAVQKGYKKEGDVYVLQVQSVGGRTLEDVSGLRTSLEKERKTVRDSETRAKAAEGAQAAAEKKAAALQKKLDAKPTDDDQAAEWAKEKKELVDQHNDALKKKDDELAKLHKKADDDFFETEVRKACDAYEAKHGKRPSRKVSVLLQDEHEISRAADGSRGMKIIDPSDGRARLSKVNHGADMGTLERLEEMSGDPDLSGFFPGSGAHGSGADGNNSAGPKGGKDDLPTGKIAAEDAGTAENLEAIAAGKATIAEE